MRAGLVLEQVRHDVQGAQDDEGDHRGGELQELRGVPPGADLHVHRQDQLGEADGGGYPGYRSPLLHQQTKELLL